MIEESPTLAVSAKAKALRAAGEPVIGFGAGEPDFPTPEHITEAAARACADPAMHRYGPAAGMAELRRAVAERATRDKGYEVTADQVVISNGGKHALANVFTALLDPGDEVIIPSPYWVSYPQQVRLAGGTDVVVETDAASGFRASVDQLEAARTDRTKILLFVSPSNPTGAVYPEDEVVAVGEWAAEHGLWIVADEIYDHLLYGDRRFVSLPVAVEDARARTVVINGVSKTYAMTGWRVGWSIAPVEVSKGISRLQSQMTSNVSNVAQAAALAAVTGPQDAVASMRQAFDRRRKIAVEHLNAIDGVDCIEPHGAFYAFPSFEGVLGRELNGRRVETTLELADVLLEAVNVAIVPGEAFGAPGYARISYALGEDDLVEGIERIARLLG